MERFVSVWKVVWLCLWACVATAVVFLPVMVSALLSPTGNLAFTLSQAWAWVMLKTTGCRICVRGRERIQRGRSYVIISNHQSQFDSLALVLGLKVQFRWVIKKELLKIPLFGYALYASRNVFIDRSDTRSAMRSVREGIRRLPPGVSVLFFAEGTRSLDGRIQEFKKGGFVAALEGGLPVLPVTVNGSRRILPKKSLVFHPGRMEVVLGEPIETRGTTRENLDELVRKTREVIVANFDPDYPGPRSC
jgi:1-acyl-sn-glycerol-3-phosphate acyltransferase